MKARQSMSIVALGAVVSLAIAAGFWFNHYDSFTATDTSDASNATPDDAAAAVVPAVGPSSEPVFSVAMSPPASPRVAAANVTTKPEPVAAGEATLETPESVESVESVRVVDVQTLANAQAAFARRDHDAVLEILGDTGAVDGCGFETHYLRGLTLRYVGRTKDSDRELDAALAIDPANTRALVNSARTLLELGRAAEAQERVQRALELQPTDADAWNVLGRLQLHANDNGAAVDAFTRATQIDAQHAHAFNNLGYAYLQMQEWQAAADALETAIALRDDVAWFHNNLGVSYERLGRLSDAVQAWQRALELRPDYEKASVSMARVTPKLEEQQQLAATEPVTGIEDDNSETVGKEGMVPATNDGSQPESPDTETQLESDSGSKSGSGATEETPDNSVSPR